MGAHPKAPSTLRSSGVRLDAHIAANPGATLGHAAGWGHLPFLAKILSASSPLSIQTHPDAPTATSGFEQENAMGVPLDSPERTYRDPNHKPELICALTPFDAKCGFRPVAQTIDLFHQIGGGETGPILQRLNQPGTDKEILADVLVWLLDQEPAIASAHTNGIAQAAVTAGDGPWNTEIGWTHRLQALYPGDPGVVVALLLNHFTLEPGEALFLEAGVLHAYLQGAGVEVMANSDNVIRGGLTPKHVDIAELSRIAVTEPAKPTIQSPSAPVHTFYAPVHEFAVTRLEVTQAIRANVAGPEVLIATSGEFTLTTATGRLAARPGHPVWIDAADQTWTAEGDGVLFRVTVPV